MEYFLQDQRSHDHELHLQGRLSRSQSLDSMSTAPLFFTGASVYSTPYNMHQIAARPHGSSHQVIPQAFYYVESPSAYFLQDLGFSGIINSDLHDAALHHHSRLQGQSERLSEPCFTDASGSPGGLSRVGSFLSSYYYSTSSEEPFSMSNVSARVQSWRKFRPANSFAHAESQVSSKWKNMVQDEMAAFKGSDLGSAPSKCCLRFTSLVVVHDPVLHSCFARRHLSLVLDCLSPQCPNYHPQGSNLSPYMVLYELTHQLKLASFNLQHASHMMEIIWVSFC
jgi:hypothetical protein